MHIIEPPKLGQWTNQQLFKLKHEGNYSLLQSHENSVKEYMYGFVKNSNWKIEQSYLREVLIALNLNYQNKKVLLLGSGSTISSQSKEKWENDTWQPYLARALSHFGIEVHAVDLGIFENEPFIGHSEIDLGLKTDISNLVNRLTKKSFDVVGSFNLLVSPSISKQTVETVYTNCINLSAYCLRRNGIYLSDMNLNEALMHKK
jgi:hypothetical protein